VHATLAPTGRQNADKSKYRVIPAKSLTHTDASSETHPLKGAMFSLPLRFTQPHYQR